MLLCECLNLDIGIWQKHLYTTVADAVLFFIKSPTIKNSYSEQSIKCDPLDMQILNVDFRYDYEITISRIYAVISRDGRNV